MAPGTGAPRAVRTGRGGSGNAGAGVAASGIADSRGLAAQRAYRAGVARGELPPLPTWASEAIDLITDLPPAADLVAALAAQADNALARAGRH